MAKSPPYVIQYFSVVGVESTLTTLKQEDKAMNLELVQLPKDAKGIILIDTESEAFIDLDGSKSLYLKCIYDPSDNPKLPPITEINFYRIKHYQGNKQILVKPESDIIEPVPIAAYPSSASFKVEKATAGKAKKNVVVYRGNYDLTELLKGEKQHDTCLCLCYKRETTGLPIFDVRVKTTEVDNVLKIPPHYRGVLFRMGPGKNRILSDAAFEAEIIDRYPRTDRAELVFPDAIQKFCFPNGLRLCLDGEQTTPTFFSFILTNEEGRRVYGACLTIYEPLPAHLRPKLETKYYIEHANILAPKALCIISQHSFITQFKEVLKQLYRIHLSQSRMPLERYVCNFTDEILVPAKGQNLVQYEIGNTIIPFYRPLNQIPPYASNEDYEYLFRSLSIENIIDVFTALLLEKKIVLLSSHRALLSHVSLALVNMLYPFAWPHVLIPILPESMKAFLEAPVPFLIGLDQDTDFQDLPLEIMRVHLDNNKVLIGDSLPKVPSSLYKLLYNRLKAAVTLTVHRPDPILEAVDQAFNVVLIDPDEKVEFDYIAVRDSVFEFIAKVLKGYEKLITPPVDGISGAELREIFNVKAFLAKKDATKPNSFIYKLTETTMFANFIEIQFLDGPEKQELLYFSKLITQERSKTNPNVIKPFVPLKTTRVYPPNTQGVDPSRIYQYTIFPKLNPAEFTKTRLTDQPVEEAVPAIVFKKEDDKTRIEKMSNSELTRYMLECIFDVWFKVFTDSIRLYPKLNHIDFIRYAYNLLNLIKKKYKPLKNLELLYKRMIEACGMCEQKEEAARIFQDIKKDSIEPSVDTFNAYFQACGKALHNVGKKTGGVEAKMTVEEEKKAAAAMEKEKKQQEKLLRIIHKVVIELSNRCPNPECDRYLREEEIITAWPRSLHTYSIKCPACGKEFIPDLSVQFSPEKEKHYYFLFPPLFAKEVHNLIENKSSNIFFKPDFYKLHKVTFWNMVFYFRLINQPYFMLDLNYKRKITDILKIIRRQPSLPSKQADTKVVLEPAKKRVTEARIFSSASSVRMDAEASSVGRSEPGKYKSGSSRKEGSSIASGGEQEKQPGSTANSHVVKYFGPLFEEYRQRKVEMKVELLGPAIHTPFAQVPVMKGGRTEPQIPMPPPMSRKALDISTPKLYLGGMELKSNDLANSIIDESQGTTKSEPKITGGDNGKKPAEFRTPTSKGTVSSAKI